MNTHPHGESNSDRTWLPKDFRAESRGLIRLLTTISIFAGALTFLAQDILAQPAPDANSVLILSSADPDGIYAARASAAGLTVVTATDAQWAARTTAEFATFKAIILGDPGCSLTPPTAAVANASVWGAAIDGPILVIGTDEHFHQSFGISGASTLINSGIGFVTSGEVGQTGAYISLSCYYDGSAPMPVPLLAPFGVFTAAGTGALCFNDSHIVAVHPALAGSTDATLSNWSCSVHEIFTSFPNATFLPLAIARNVTGAGQLTFADNSSGVPYILASGGGITPIRCGNAIVEPPEECDDGNTSSGDGCSSFCTIESPTPPPTPTPTPPPSPTPTPTPTPPPPRDEICRGPGFWGTHAGTEKSGSQPITQSVLGNFLGTLEICGAIIDNVNVGSAHSALEAICVSPKGDSRLQLARQLAVAALNCGITNSTDSDVCTGAGESGAAPCAGVSIHDVFQACNAACATGTTAEVDGHTVSCIGAVDCFNNGGVFDPATGECAAVEGTSCQDRSLVNGCFDFQPPGPAGSPRACNEARKNGVTILP
jgi:cysteine-rich repeat protein